MALSGKNVAITAAENQSQQTHEVEQKTSGLTLALSGTAGSALNSVVQATQDARSAGSSRLQALQGVKAALSGVQASQAARLDAAQGNDPANNNTVGVSLSYGSQSSKSTQRSEQTTAQGSSLTAGRDLSITAREGDLNAVGSQLKAGNDVALSASRDITLQSAQNTSAAGRQKRQPRRHGRRRDWRRLRRLGDQRLRQRQQGQRQRKRQRHHPQRNHRRCGQPAHPQQRARHHPHRRPGQRG
jgi:hypothetical protein